MNLHGIVSGVVSAVNPNVLVTVFVSTGPTENPDGSQSPTYAAPVQVLAQVQSLTFGDIQQADNLNIQGVRRTIYLNGEVDGLIRERNKGGDLVQLPDGSIWLVAHVLEYWPDWTKAIITLQDDTALPAAGTGTTTSSSGVAAPISPTRYASIRIANSDPITIALPDNGNIVGVRKNAPSPTTIPLPDTQMEGFAVAIKDMLGDAATNNIAVTSTLLIDGESQFVLTEAWQSETFYRTDTGWAII